MGKPTRDQMYQWRIAEKLPILTIARKLQCRNQAVVDLLREYDLIPRRARVTYEWLVDQYVTQGKDVDRLALELQCDEATIRYYLRKYAIPISYKTRGSVRFPALHDRDLLYGLYHGSQMTLMEIARELGCAMSSVCWAFLRLKISTRAPLQRVENPLTRQGYHVFTARQRRLILERDRYQCRMPECKRTSKNLEVHHIIPRYRGGGSDIGNGITICRRCHWKTYGNENEFEELLLALVQEPLA